MIEFEFVGDKKIAEDNRMQSATEPKPALY